MKILNIERNERVVLKRNSAINIISNILADKMYLIISFLIFIKTILFMGLLGTPKATGINLYKGFFSVPPFLVFFSFVMIILSFSFLFKGRKHLWSMIIINILATILIIGDAWYFRGFSGFLNFFLMSQTSNLDNLGSSVVSMFRPIDFIFIIDIILLIVYAAFNRELYRGVRRSVKLFLVTLIIPILYLTYVHYKVDVFKRCFNGQMLFRQSWAPNQTMSNLGPIGYHIYDGFKYYIDSKPYSLTAKEKQDINTWYDKKQENLPDNQYAGMFKGKNLLVIQWESLENFVVNQKIQGQEITPNLNKLLKNSLYFDNYHENVYNGTSSDADLLTNTGVYPVREGSTFFRYPNNKYQHSLPLLMQDMGYSTYAIHPDKGSYWNWMPALGSIGFQKCYDASQYKMTEQIGLGISDHEFLTQVAPIIEKEKQPFYSFVVTLTSHAPFDLPQKYREMKLDNGFDKNILGDYFQSIHYTDKEIGNFLDTLGKAGLLQNTVVVIYGDHTSVHKFYSDEADAVRPSQDWWMHNDMRIPLVIYNPSIQGQTLDIQGGQIDLMPTVSYLMGVDKKKYERDALGKVLLNTNKDYTILQSFKMYGKYTPEDAQHAKDGILLSDKMVQSDYFKGK
ncbi:MAG: LTA synthase family protein [Bacillota bacterium]|nr:LTA synthase family protein [Bacillota bacterium]